MNWNSLGIIKPTFEWQLYDLAIVGSEIFRVTNTWTIPPFYRLRAYLGQFFATNEVIISSRIYPFKNIHRIIELKIPDDFKQDGIITRYVGVKLGNINKLGLYPYDWQVELWEYLEINANDSQSTHIFSFTDTNLNNSDSITINHSLNSYPKDIIVLDGDGIEIYPDNFIYIDTNNLSIKLTSYRPLTGTWKTIISK